MGGNAITKTTNGPASTCWRAGPLRVRELVAESLQLVHDDGCCRGIAFDQRVERNEPIVCFRHVGVAEGVHREPHVLCGERFVALQQLAPWARHRNEGALDPPGEPGLLWIRLARGNTEVFLELAGEVGVGNQPGVDVGEVFADSPELIWCRASDQVRATRERGLQHLPDFKRSDLLPRNQGIDIANPPAQMLVEVLGDSLVDTDGGGAF